MVKKTKVKIVIAKSMDGSFAFISKHTGSGLVSSRPISVQEAKNAIDKMGLAQESRVLHDDGTTRYTYA